MMEQPGTRSLLITSALPYCNNSPHLGNLIGAILSGDVYARYARLRGWNVLFVCGTDEYGTATEALARKLNKTPREVCDEFSKIHTSVYDWFGISFDFWGRTSTPKHTEIVQELFLGLHKNGFIQEDSLEQLYCENCKMFLADRFVEGTCPECAFVGARGDQCDGCGKLIDAITLINPRCMVCQSSPITKSSKHLFLDLKQLQSRVQEWKDDRASHWSKNAQSITQTWLDGGLDRRCITRDLKWGVPVPLQGWEDKVFYVWFDACPGYISLTANYTDEWRQWWCNPENVELVQFMGKDNVPFHTVVFPATLLGSGQKWTTLNNLSTTEYLNYEGGKFSKSRNLGVFGTDVMKEGLAPHVWRFYLLATRPETVDADFQWEDFVAKNNTEFVANIGNLVFRLLNLVTSAFEGKVPPLVGDLTPDTVKFVSEVEEKVALYIDHMDKLQLRDGLRAALQVSSAANGYLTSQAPWTLEKKDRAAAGSVLYVLVQAASLLNTLMSPFVPTFSDELARQLNFPVQKLKGPAFSFDVPAGHAIGDKIAPIVQQIDGERILEWWQRYGSSQLNAIHLEFKVGQIVNVSLHPQGGEKYVCLVNVGLKEPLSVVARIQHLYKEEELLNSKVVVLTNLKHGQFQGVPSQGMILGAEDNTGAYGLLRVDNACPVGAKVMPEGWNCKATPNMNIKEFQKEKIYTREDGSVWWDSLKKVPEFKKQPKVNPKAQGKNKAAPKAELAGGEIVPVCLVANAPGGKVFPVTAEKVKTHPAKIK